MLLTTVPRSLPNRGLLVIPTPSRFCLRQERAERRLRLGRFQCGGERFALFRHLRAERLAVAAHQTASCRERLFRFSGEPHRSLPGGLDQLFGFNDLVYDATAIRLFRIEGVAE